MRISDWSSDVCSYDLITYAKVTDDILLPVENKPNKAWWIGFTLAALGALLWVFRVSYTFWTGIGAWGLNKTAGWAWDSSEERRAGQACVSTCTTRWSLYH